MGRSLQNQVVVITGASSGIGEALGNAFAGQGARVVLAARSQGKLNRVAEEIAQDKSVVPPLVVPADVTQDRDVRKLMHNVIDTYGRVDILINNAGYGVFASFVEAEDADLRGMMDVNYFGTVLCTKHALPYMQSQGKGHIVNIASVAGKIATAKASGYSASKFAVVGFSDSLRLELAGTGVHVTAVCPGPVNTPFFERADASGTYQQRVEKFMMTAEDVVRAVLKTVRRPKDEVILPPVMKVAVRLQQLFPRFVKRAGRRWLSQK